MEMTATEGILERAENWNLVALDDMKPVFGNYLVNYFTEILSSKQPEVNYLLGVKGSGKTFTIRKAIRALPPDSSILTIQYRANRRLEAFEGRNMKPVGCPSILGLYLLRYDSIVLDDIHYAFEDVALGKYAKEELLTTLRGVIKLAKEGARVVLLSEDLPSAYLSAFPISEVHDIACALGCHDQRLSEEHKEAMNYLGMREVWPPDFKHWLELRKAYPNRSLDQEVQAFLFTCRTTPRAFIRFVNLFKPGGDITMEDVHDMVKSGQLSNTKMMLRRAAAPAVGTHLGKLQSVYELGAGPLLELNQNRQVVLWHIQKLALDMQLNADPRCFRKRPSGTVFEATYALRVYLRDKGNRGEKFIFGELKQRLGSGELAKLALECIHLPQLERVVLGGWLDTKWVESFFKSFKGEESIGKQVIALKGYVAGPEVLYEGEPGKPRREGDRTEKLTRRPQYFFLPELVDCYRLYLREESSDYIIRSVLEGKA